MSRRSFKGVLGLGMIVTGIVLIVNDIFDQFERLLGLGPD